jgi:serine/threonine-protein kinase HipA
MSRCPISYEEIPDGTRYSREGLKRLSRRLRDLHDLPYSAEEQRREAVARASRMSVQGMQPKLSARLNVARGLFDIVNAGGEYILKPQTHYAQVPENEDLSMRLAETVGIGVPLHGLLHSRDGSLTYVIRRFDRAGRKGKIALEDFAQLSGRSRDTKYDSSMEQVTDVIDRFATFPAVEKVKLFRRTLFSFLIGNEDMHLKNFSLIRRNGKVELSPAYDLLNTTIAMGNVKEELALPLDGKKRNLTRRLLVEYFGYERLGLPARVVTEVLSDFAAAMDTWETRIRGSFLTGAMQEKYIHLASQRRRILSL